MKFVFKTLEKKHKDMLFTYFTRHASCCSWLIQ